ncbi:MAG: altronate dehydratase family protein [Planctomycetes bacterium]|nr:altronate dehydratase family protein [Planctomycetota bacterium]
MSSTTHFNEAAVVLDERDNVAVARQSLSAGTVVKGAPGATGTSDLTLLDAVEPGHRFATVSVAKGDLVRQYGEPIGTSLGIHPGARIDHGNMTDEVPIVRELPAHLDNPGPTTPSIEKQLKFDGFLRSDGRTGTRNWVLVIPTSMCASHEAQQIATISEFQHWSVEQHPNVDGVSAIPHGRGCGTPDGDNITTILRVLTAYATHPNVGGVVFLELGCEKTGQDLLRSWMRKQGLLSENEQTVGGRPARWIGIQQAGGTRNAIAQGLEAVAELLPITNESVRSPRPISELTLGVECGGSDGFSGISANPALGRASDLLIGQGGTVILSEVPEFCGAEHLLAHRARDRMVGKEVYAMVDWYRDRAARLGKDLNMNPSPGNIAGGLLNVTIKSLGAIAKGGTTPVQGTMDYGCPTPRRGLNLMQGPGYDQESVPGLVASGATAVIFTTGRGTTIGNAICPVIKLATNTAIYERMQGDLDLNTGTIIDGDETIDRVGARVFERLREISSGHAKSCAEETGHREFNIWAPDPLSL